MNTSDSGQSDFNLHHDFPVQVLNIPVVAVKIR